MALPPDRAADVVAVAKKASANAPVRSRNSKARKAGERFKEGLHTWSTLPDYLRDNEFIKSHYRANVPVKRAWKDLFNLHNETGNIWTHFLGFLLFVILTVLIARSPPTPLAFGKQHVDTVWETLRDRVQLLGGGLGQNLLHLQDSFPKLPNLEDLQHGVEHIHDSLHHTAEHLQHSLHNTVEQVQHSLHSTVHTLQEDFQHTAQTLKDTYLHAVDNLNQLVQQAMSSVVQYPTARWPTYVFMAGAMICLFLSSTCHLYGCCAKHISQFVWRLDYSGIAILIVASFYPPVYYGFLCQPFWRYFYLITISVLGCGTVMVSLMSLFQTRKWRTFRASLFAGLGLFGVAPVLHQLWIHHDVWHVRQALINEIGMGATYLIGAFFYASRIPERFMPGKFDLWLHSHQIFHIAVVIAAYIHYRAVLLMLQWRDASGGCAAPLTTGPVELVYQEMQESGHDLFGIDQVFEKLRLYAFDHLGLGHLAQSL